MESRPTSSGSWQAELARALEQSRPPDRPARVALLGIGHPLRGDDAAGLRVAQSLAPDALGPGWLIVSAGPAPESHTGPLRRFAPDLVLLVDAAEMGGRIGDVRWLDGEEIDGVSASTHTLPVSMLARFLQSELHCRVSLLGIQPGDTELGAEVSDPVELAVREVVAALIQLA